MSVTLTIAQGDFIKVHAADCSDLKKVAVRRAAYNGIHTQEFADGTTERDVWIDFNIDFLEESLAMGEDDPSLAAWPLEFLPCCKRTGLVSNPDRTYSADHKN